MRDIRCWKYLFGIKVGENSKVYLFVYGGEPFITGDIDKDKVIIKRYIDEKEVANV